MHRPLTNLPGRALIDSNVLLQAAFVADGLALRAVRAAAELGYSICIDEQSWSDAIRVLTSKASTLGLAYDPVAVIDGFAKRSAVLFLPPSPPRTIKGVNPADRHLASAALDHGAWVLTEDAPLVVELSRIGVEARFSWDVLFEHVAKSDPPLHYVCRVVRPARDIGTYSVLLVHDQQIVLNVNTLKKLSGWLRCQPPPQALRQVRLTFVTFRNQHFRDNPRGLDQLHDTCAVNAGLDSERRKPFEQPGGS